MGCPSYRLHSFSSSGRATRRGGKLSLPTFISKSERPTQSLFENAIFDPNFRFGELMPEWVTPISLHSFSSSDRTTRRGGKATFPTSISKCERPTQSLFENAIFDPNFRFGEQMLEWVSPHTVYPRSALVAEPLEVVGNCVFQSPLANQKGPPHPCSGKQSLNLEWVPLCTNPTLPALVAEPLEGVGNCLFQCSLANQKGPPNPFSRMQSLTPISDWAD